MGERSEISSRQFFQGGGIKVTWWRGASGSIRNLRLFPSLGIEIAFKDITMCLFASLPLCHQVHSKEHSFSFVSTNLKSSQSFSELFSKVFKCSAPGKQRAGHFLVWVLAWLDICVCPSSLHGGVGHLLEGCTNPL